jgi:hypothetical protein
MLLSDRIGSGTMPGFGVICIDLKEYSASELLEYHEAIN